MTNTLTAASRQWASRPADERYLSLTDMLGHFRKVREASHEHVTNVKHIQFSPVGDDADFMSQGLVAMVEGKGFSEVTTPTHFSFGQLSNLAGAPAGYLRKLPASVAALNLNVSMKMLREIPEIAVLTTEIDGEPVNELRAATGPNYGRIWNETMIAELVNRFGDGVTGDVKVPGEFGKDVPITKANTTLYASDRDLFVFLADEKNRIEVPNRRNGQAGSFARGFFAWNSEVGSASAGGDLFLFDFACQNRIVWGVEEHLTFRIRHTSSAPDKFRDNFLPTLDYFQELGDRGLDTIEIAIKAAKEDKIASDVNDYLAASFPKTMVPLMIKAHEVEEGRPIETRWDAVTAAAAAARSIKWQGERLAIERVAGKLLKAA